MKDENYFARMLAETLGQGDAEIMRASLGNAEVCEILGITNEELGAFVNFVGHLTAQSVTLAVALGSIDLNESGYEDSIVNTASITTLLMAKSYFKAEEKKRVDDDKSKYPVTLMAEAHVRNHKTTGNLDSIWPVEVVKEVLEEFTPEEAFMVGVVCGKSHG